MKFNDYKYVRPDMDKLKKDHSDLLIKFSDATDFETVDNIMKEINQLTNNFETMENLVSIRNSIDTTDEYYEKEQDYINEISPFVEEMTSKYYEKLVNSRFRPELEAKWGAQIFRIADLKIKTFSPEIIENLQKESKLGTEYSKLRASAKIMFDGEERNIPQMEPYTQSPDRKVREEAQLALTKFYTENASEFDRIYDEVVKERHQMAVKLGYDNYVQLGYDRLGRTDYDAKMVANYRKQVEEELVPLATKLRERQAKRLGIETLMYYDENLEFLSGNATPKGSPEDIINNGKKMYEELSTETGEFFNFMLDHDLLDLVSKKGKAGGGYCTFISDYKAPFIFSNFNGTAGDVDVLTHEAGHAFQVYQSRDFELPEYIWPTYEACEIHSMSMEFLAWPWMGLFFEEQEEKYKFSHLAGSLLFIPYGVTVDEFQHWVYENPTATPAERNAAWRKIEMKYLPHRNYGDNDFLNNGGFWYRQGHVYHTAFYYIDYTLAQVCAFQFWVKANENRENAWTDYLHLCKQGGSKSFLELVDVANLNNPFVDGCMKSVVSNIDEWLSCVDDGKF